MIKTSVHKLANDIGFDIANGDDEDQANLLNGFGKGFQGSMDKLSQERQMSYIVDKLDQKAINTIKMLNEFIKLKENE